MSDWSVIAAPSGTWTPDASIDGLWLGGYRSTAIAGHAIAGYAIAGTSSISDWLKTIFDGLWLGGYQSTSIAGYAIAGYAIAGEPQESSTWIKVYPDA